MKSLSYYINLVESEERALDTFVYDRAVASFTKLFSRFDSRFPSVQKLGAILQADMQKIMDDLVKTHRSGFLKGFFQSVPLVKIQIDRDGTEIDDRYLSSPHELEAYAHTVAVDLIKILRNVPENMQSMMMNTILNNRNLMASKSKSYERYMEHASNGTLHTLDAMVSRLLHKHFDS